jgi:hypothetical protein
MFLFVCETAPTVPLETSTPNTMIIISNYELVENTVSGVFG